jgi:hypothetical protein
MSGVSATRRLLVEFVRRRRKGIAHDVSLGQTAPRARHMNEATAGGVRTVWPKCHLSRIACQSAGGEEASQVAAAELTGAL